MRRDSRDIGYKYGVTNTPGAPQEVYAMKPFGVEPKAVIVKTSHSYPLSHKELYP